MLMASPAMKGVESSQYPSRSCTNALPSNFLTTATCSSVGAAFETAQKDRVYMIGLDM